MRRWPYVLAGVFVVPVVLVVPRLPVEPAEAAEATSPLSTRVPAPLATHYPSAVPDAATRKGWQAVQGTAEVADEGVIYAFFVNPAYEGLYQLTQFRTWKRSNGLVVEDTEKVVWNAQPGVRTPLLVFELVDGAWKSMPPGNAEYDRQIVTVIRIYELHRKASGLGGF
jgi:hypothetical protein